MTVSTNNIKFRPEWFGAYGLDNEKNFMKAPECECGCGEKALLMINNKEDLFGMTASILMENDCDHCAIFAYAFDDRMYAIIKTKNDIDSPVLYFGAEAYMDFFREWDDELELHCYGLMIETRKGEWKVVEE